MDIFPKKSIISVLQKYFYIHEKDRKLQTTVSFARKDLITLTYASKFNGRSPSIGRVI